MRESNIYQLIQPEINFAKKKDEGISDIRLTVSNPDFSLNRCGATDNARSDTRTGAFRHRQPQIAVRHPLEKRAAIIKRIQKGIANREEKMESKWETQ